MGGIFSRVTQNGDRSDTRRRLRAQSRHSSYYGCLLIFNTPPEICLSRNRLRSRNVEEQVIPYHAGLLQQTLLDAPNEGWEQVHVLGIDDMDAQIEVEP